MTLPRRALVANGADVAIVASRGAGAMIASYHRCTEVDCAGISIIAVGLGNADAIASAATIADGAWVTVIARLRIVGMGAAHQRQTGVVGAGI